MNIYNRLPFHQVQCISFYIMSEEYMYLVSEGAVSLEM